MTHLNRTSSLLFTTCLSILPLGNALADDQGPPLGDLVEQEVESRYWFVSPSGSDFLWGTKRAPFRTIGRAFAAARDGDTIRLLPGTHRLSAEVSLSGKAVHFLGDLDADGAPASILSGDRDGDGAPDVSLIRAKDISSSNWGFRNLEFRDGEEWGLSLENTEPYIDNCRFAHNDTGLVTDAAAAEVTECTFVENQYGCFDTSGPRNVSFTDCTFRANSWGIAGDHLDLRDSSFSGHAQMAVSCLGRSAIAYCTFQDNNEDMYVSASDHSMKISRCRFKGGSASASALSLDSYRQMISVSNCLFTGYSDIAISANGCDVFIDQCVIRDNPGNGLHLSDGVVITDSTIESNGGYGIYGGMYWYDTPYSCVIDGCLIRENGHHGVWDFEGNWDDEGSFDGVSIRNSTLCGNGTWNVYDSYAGKGWNRVTRRIPHWDDGGNVLRLRCR